jgi:hypothetical protein
MYPRVAAASLKLNAYQAVADGEIVALDLQGRPSFQALQHRGLHPGHQIVYYAFDLLHVDGEDLTRRPLLKRQNGLSLQNSRSCRECGGATYPRIYPPPFEPNEVDSLARTRVRPAHRLKASHPR